MRNEIPFCFLLGAMATLLSVAPDGQAQAAPATVAPTNNQLFGQRLASAKSGEKLRFAQADTGRGTPSASAFFPASQAKRWPGGNVPYIFDKALTIGQRSAFIEAAREWEEVAQIKFLPRTGEADYIRITNLKADGSISAIGDKGGEQIVALSTTSKFDAVHELGHTLGLMNEQQRSDRDKFVTIDPTNIVVGQESNFTLIPDSENSGTYDFGSIMHDSQFAYAKDVTKPTIKAKEDFVKFQTTMGQRFQISNGDRNNVGKVYGYRNFYQYPQNDNFAEAEDISGPSGNLAANNVNGYHESGEKNHAEGGGTSSIWYRWRPATGGRVTFSTEGSEINTSLAVYLGLSVSTVTEIASSNDINPEAVPPVLTSQVSFEAQPGATYYIAVDGTLNTSNIIYQYENGIFPIRSSGDTGPIQLSWAQNADTSRLQLSGFVRTRESQGIGGVIITLSGADQSNSATSTTVTTGTSGEYSIPNLLAGNYTLSASKGGFTFEPSPLNVNLTANSTGNNFTANAIPVPPLPEMYVSDVVMREGKKGDISLTFNVSMSIASKETVTVDYMTANGTAMAGSDYNATQGTLVFAPGRVSMTVSVKLRPDANVESDETFALNLSNASGAKIAKETGTATLVNDD
ncbi:Carboxypeptidase regulatory-like domain-containing protein [Abditibacterium utsteinense]|uniref:Carboxypeptidase regulatory-like domain-containing protein n=1 Tax=Abditibacterium utsteinense TaxID=1960156 RepID=A0A2S8SV99_9BACT|nr:M12 family metallopeptidase [Abditibacterium utsteinense]PQV64727.1 Carboxypeptidase regulatory-like domain-containing protein [Abditibacterium utsteinense]